MTRLTNTATAVTALVAAVALFLLASGLSAAAPGAPDTTAPTGAVGGVHSPASGTLELRLYASDGGSGLAGAETTLDGISSYVRLGSGSCPEHPAPGSEPPVGAECPELVSAVALSLDTHAVADGEHELRVWVTDGSGNVVTLIDEVIVVNNAPHVTGDTATVTIGVGSAGEGGGEESGGGEAGGNAAGGGERNAQSSSLALRRKVCRAPRLRMRLYRPRPRWFTHPKHVPVLRFGGRYTYKGRLTCKVSGRRVSAPKGTPVNVFYRVWELTFKRKRGPVRKLRKRPIRVRKGGRLRVKLGGFRTGRTLYFRYRQGTAMTKAKVRVAVAPRGILLPRWRR